MNLKEFIHSNYIVTYNENKIDCRKSDLHKTEDIEENGTFDEIKDDDIELYLDKVIGEIVIRGLILKKLVIDKVSGKINFSNCLIDYLEIKNSINDSIVSFNDLNSRDKVDIKANGRNWIFNNCVFNDVSITGKNNIKINGGSAYHFKIKGGVNNIELLENLESIEISKKSEIDYLELENVKSISFEGINNLKALFITKSSVRTLKLKDCKFSSSTWINVDSTFNSIQVENTEWPRKFKDNVSINDIEFIKRLKSGLTQDRFSTIHFNALENEYYLKSLNRQILSFKKDSLLLEQYTFLGKIKMFIKHFPIKFSLGALKRNILEVIVLSLNSWTNYHGTKWGRTFVWILLSGVFLYTAYCLKLGFDLNFIKENWGQLFIFILPTHSVDFLKVEKLTNAALAIDSVSRIVFSYLIYQFIVAFRKYGKQ